MNVRLSGLIRAAAALGLLAGAACASAQETIKLRFSTMLPPMTTHHRQVIVPWVEEVKRRSGGRLEIAVFPASSICKPNQQYECARDGVVDIAFGLPGWTPNRFPLTSVMELPFMHRSAATGSQMLADLWDKYLASEYKDVHVLAMNMQPAGHLITRTRPVRTLEDAAGLKLRAPTAVTGDLVERLGAAKVGLPAPELYQAMSNRVIDGYTLNYEGVLAFKLNEVSRYYTEVAMYSTPFVTFMNLKAYQALPADLRAVLDETTAHAAGYWKNIGAAWDRNDAGARKTLADGGGEIIEVSAQERRRWADKVAPIDEAWAAGLEAKGLPGRALLKDARALAAKYGEGMPGAAAR